jgi:hypothetical protein
MPPSRYPSSLTITMSASHGLTTAPLLTQTKQSPQPSISNTTPVNHLSTLQTKQPTTITDRSPVKNSNPITTSDPRLIPCRPILTAIVLPSSLDSPASIRRQDPVHLQAADEPRPSCTAHAVAHSPMISAQTRVCSAPPCLQHRALSPIDPSIRREAASHHP